MSPWSLAARPAGSFASYQGMSMVSKDLMYLSCQRQACLAAAQLKHQVQNQPSSSCAAAKMP